MSGKTADCLGPLPFWL